MSCFFQGLINGLSDNMIIFFTKQQLLEYLKKNNIQPRDVKVNGKGIKPQQLRECKEHIKNIQDINNGYDCSAMDPILMLLCQKFKLKIIHNFDSNQIIYHHKNFNKVITFHSNKSHFWYK